MKNVISRDNLFLKNLSNIDSLYDTFSFPSGCSNNKCLAFLLLGSWNRLLNHISNTKEENSEENTVKKE